MQPKRQRFITIKSLLRYTFTVEPYSKPKKEKINALATIPCAEVSNEMVQGFGWLQVTKCAQSSIFNPIDKTPAGSRHDGINDSGRSEQQQ